MSVVRPPPIEVDDEECRRDIESDEMRKVNPDLPSGDSRARIDFLVQCDYDAYCHIRNDFPAFLPPTHSHMDPKKLKSLE